MSIIRELKQRKVFRVAAVYAVLAWGILQVVDVISEPLSLPLWFSTVTILLLAIGFPVALIFSWIFDFGPEGPTRTVTDASATTGARGGFEVALLVVLIIGIGWLIFRDISDVLADLPVITQKEAIGSTWDREVQILKQKPSLVLIHRSAFFHSMNQELGIGYPTGAEDYSDEFRRLYQIADNKLVALLGFLANGSHGTKFLVYSRGAGRWSEFSKLGLSHPRNLTCQYPLLSWVKAARLSNIFCVCSANSRVGNRISARSGFGCWCIKKPVQHGQQEGGGFAAAGFRRHHQVFACENRGYGALLHRGRLAKTQLIDGLEELFVQWQV